jgi:heme/copper-type cytochrome/quinol oxidase subunit 2
MTLEGVVIILVVGGCLDLVSGQQNCPEQTDPAVIVVATIFATLAVVFIVAGVIFFLIWRRRRGEAIQNSKIPGILNHF